MKTDQNSNPNPETTVSTTTENSHSTTRSEHPSEVNTAEKTNTTTENACCSALRTAARQLGYSPSKADYESLGLTPASATIIRTLGGWNAAKQQARLKTNPSTGSSVALPPNTSTSTTPFALTGRTSPATNAGTTATVNRTLPAHSAVVTVSALGSRSTKPPPAAVRAVLKIIQTVSNFTISTRYEREIHQQNDHLRLRKGPPPRRNRKMRTPLCELPSETPPP